MQLDDKARKALQRAVLDDMAEYLSGDALPPAGSTIGRPWSKDRVSAELGAMRSFLVEPYASEYDCDDSLVPEGERLPCGKRSAYVVAEDGPYRLLFDPESRDFVLVQASRDGRWASWGIRGDASSTFLAR